MPVEFMDYKHQKSIDEVELIDIETKERSIIKNIELINLDKSISKIPFQKSLKTPIIFNGDLFLLPEIVDLNRRYFWDDTKIHGHKIMKDLAITI